MSMYIFPGQGAQFKGMGKEQYDASPLVRQLFDKANDIMDFDLVQTMFEGSDEELKQTRVTQPAMFLYAMGKLSLLESFSPKAVAGHSLGEMTALVASKVLSFEDGMNLVRIRANAVQRACDLQSGTMSAILGASDEAVIKACAEVSTASAVVIAANFNCPGQIVISGSVEGIEKACELLKSQGYKAIALPVGGAFHSPLMEPARAELAEAINKATFNTPICPIYQNVDAKPYLDSGLIKANLIAQLTSPVLWTQTIQNMAADNPGVGFVEVGGKVLQGMVKKINKELSIESV